MFVVGAPCIVEPINGAEYHLIQTIPIDSQHLFIALAHHFIDLWSFEPTCLLGRVDKGNGFLEESKGGYAQRVRYSGTEKHLEVYRKDGLIDIFKIVSTPTSILPVHQMSLATPKVKIEFESTMDSEGRIVGPKRLSSPVITASVLYRMQNGILGLRASDGFRIFEWEYQGGKSFDLKQLKLNVNLSSEGDIPENLIAVSEDGLLVTLGEDNQTLLIINISSQSISHSFNLSSEVECICWLKNDFFLIKSKGDRSAFIYQIQYESVKKFISLPINDKILSACVCPIKSSFIVHVCESSGNKHLVKFSVSQMISTSGPYSKITLFEVAGGLMSLRLSTGIFNRSANSPSSYSFMAPFDSIETGDQTIIWEHVDVPLNGTAMGSNNSLENSSIRQMKTDHNGDWVAVAGQVGFCICSMSQRRWNLFANPLEEGDLEVLNFAWIQSSTGQTPLLAIILNRLSSQKKEFRIIDPALNLEMNTFLHRQPTSQEILAMDCAGPDLLGILTEDGNLQIIKVNRGVEPNSLDMELLIAASVEVFKDSAVSPTKWKFSFCGSLNHGQMVEDFSVFIIQRGDVLFTVAVPPPPPFDEVKSVEGKVLSSPPKREIIAKIIRSSGVLDFFVWYPNGRTHDLWIVIITAAEGITLLKWPFDGTDASINVPCDSIPNCFYSQLAGGLFVCLQNTINQEAFKISVKQTISLLPHYLHHNLKFMNKDHFVSLLNDVFKGNKASSSGQEDMIIELLLLQILENSEGDFQSVLLEKIADILRKYYQLPRVLTILSTFCRRIELTDAWKVMNVFSIPEELIHNSISDCFLEVAMSFWRICVLADPPQSSDNVEKYSTLDMLLASIEQCNESVLKGILSIGRDMPLLLQAEDIKSIIQEIVKRRIWHFIPHFDHIPKINTLLKSVTIEEVPLESSLYTMILLQRPDINGLFTLLEQEHDAESGSAKERTDGVFHFLVERQQLVEAGLWQLINNKDPSYIRKNFADSADFIKSLLIKLKTVI